MTEAVSDSEYSRTDPRALIIIKAFFQEKLREASHDLIDNYVTQNHEPKPLEQIYGRIEVLELLTEAELSVIFSGSNNGWSKFREKFPRSQGVLRISVPAFSSDGLSALISMDQQSDWLAGYGVCFLYQKIEGIWKQRDKVMTRIS